MFLARGMNRLKPWPGSKSNGSVKNLVVERQHAHDACGMLSQPGLLHTAAAQQGDVDLLNVYDAATIPATTVKTRTCQSGKRQP